MVLRRSLLIAPVVAVDTLEPVYPLVVRVLFVHTQILRHLAAFVTLYGLCSDVDLQREMAAEKAPTIAPRIAQRTKLKARTFSARVRPARRACISLWSKSLASLAPMVMT